MGPSATKKDSSRGTKPLLHKELPSSLLGAVFDPPSSKANRSLRTCRVLQYETEKQAREHVMFLNKPIDAR